MGQRVKPQALKGEHAAGAGLSFSQRRRDPCEEFFHLKGFCHIIGGALQQQIYLAVKIRLCTEDDNGKFPDTGQHLFAGEAGQHQIQQDKVRRGGSKHKKRLRSGVGAQNQISFFCQDFFQHIADIDIVIDDQDLFHTAPRFCIMK